MKNLLWVIPTFIVAATLIVEGNDGELIGYCLVGLLAIFALVTVYRRNLAPSPNQHWAWELLVLPTVLALGNAGVPRPIAIGALLFLVLAALGRRSRPRDRTWYVAPILLVAAALWVSLRSSSFELPVATIGACATAWLVSRSVGSSRAIISTLDGVGLYLVANVFAYFVLGARSVGADMRIGSLESTFGTADRVVFPLVTNLNLAPVMAAVFLVAVPLLFDRSGWRRLVFRLVSFACAIVVLVASNGRAALVIGVAVAVLVLLVPALVVRVAPVGAGLSVVFVMIFPVVAGIITTVFTLLTTVAPGLARDGGSEDPASLANRDVIWGQSSSYWFVEVPTSSKVLGYGPLGQYLSGASSTYGSTLSGTSAYPEYASVHNSFLQQLFDGGIAGALLLSCGVILTAIGATRLRPHLDLPHASAVGAVLVLAITSITEVTLAPGYGEESYFVLVSLSFALAAGGNTTIMSAAAAPLTGDSKVLEPRHAE